MAERDRKSADPETQQEELVRTQRDVNEELVLATLRAQAVADAAEGREQTLVETAELREQLMGILGHDLRNPLSAIMMGAGLLLGRGQLDDEDARIVGRIVNSGTRMTRMIGQVLDFTRARLGGGFEIQRKAAEMGAICRNVADELDVGNTVPVRCSVDGEARGEWDVDRISQVLSNIGGNAIEHAAPGTSVVFAVRSDEQRVYVDVSNLGPPIDPAILPFLFEPFRQARAAPRKGGNLGLGLFIAREIVVAHGGTLEAASAEGKTTFRIVLPRQG